MRILVYGASISQGFWDTEGGWVARLRKHYDELQVENFNDEQPTVFNLGISGDTTRGVLKRIKNETEARVWPGEDFLFIICVGTNNSLIKSDGTNLSEPEEYKKDLASIVDEAKKFSDGILFVELPPCDEKLTHPVAWADVHYSNDRIGLFNAAMREVAAGKQISVVPVFETFSSAFMGGKELFADGLHPNNEGHKLIFELVRPAVDDFLK